jgi:phospholipase/carboxylesterase
MSEQNLSLVHRVQEPREKVEGQPPLLLLLHGIGSNEDDLFGLAPYLDGRFFVVSARAPLVMGPSSFGWFNIEFTPRGMVADVEQARHSHTLLLKFLDEVIEKYKVDPACVYLMGFSQGAAMSLSVALTHPEKLGGVVAMSGRFPSLMRSEMADREAFRGLPILITHGIYDPVLPIEDGRAVREKLEALPVELAYHEYPMGHEVSVESLREVSAWLKSSLDRRCAIR